jgi:hypothetical protein
MWQPSPPAPPLATGEPGKVTCIKKMLLPRPGGEWAFRSLAAWAPVTTANPFPDAMRDRRKLYLEHARLQDVERIDRLNQFAACQGKTWSAKWFLMHKRLGFLHVGILRGVGFKVRALDSVLMQRSQAADLASAAVDDRSAASR